MKDRLHRVEGRDGTGANLGNIFFPRYFSPAGNIRQSHTLDHILTLPPDHRFVSLFKLFSTSNLTAMTQGCIVNFWSQIQCSNLKNKITSCISYAFPADILMLHMQKKSKQCVHVPRIKALPFSQTTEEGLTLIVSQHTPCPKSIWIRFNKER